jgi:hypothetical protein
MKEASYCVRQSAGIVHPIIEDPYELKPLLVSVYMPCKDACKFAIGSVKQGRSTNLPSAPIYMMTQDVLAFAVRTWMMTAGIVRSLETLSSSQESEGKNPPFTK